MSGAKSKTKIEPLANEKDYVFKLPAVDGWQMITLFTE